MSLVDINTEKNLMVGGGQTEIIYSSISRKKIEISPDPLVVIYLVHVRV